MITELSRFRSLLVIARNSTFAYKGAPKDIRQIARELNVRYVVEGSVRRAGDRLRVTAQVIEAASGSHVWAEKWDRTMEDLFDLQDELTRAIVTAVEPELGAHERTLARQKPTASLTAWELCQRGCSELVTYSDDGLVAAEKLLTAAADADPSFALPYAHLARLAWLSVTSGRTTDAAADIESGLAHARRAIELDDRLELGHMALGVLLAISGREDDARAALETAIALDQNNAQCRFAIAVANLFLTRPDGNVMMRNGAAALALSPKDPVATMFQFIITLGHLYPDFDWTNPEFLSDVRAAARYPHADYFIHMCAATGNIAAGDIEAAKRCIAAALERRPSLTLATWRTAFHFPTWPEMFRSSNEYTDTLIALCLPRE